MLLHVSEQVSGNSVIDSEGMAQPLPGLGMAHFIDPLFAIVGHRPEGPYGTQINYLDINFGHGDLLLCLGLRTEIAHYRAFALPSADMNCSSGMGQEERII
jgi:hypothetical protein